jgi:hypothetical protein
VVDLLQFYEGFEINDHSGMQLSDDDVLQAHYFRFQAFQLLAFKQVPKLRDFALCSIGSLHKRADLTKRLLVLTDEELQDLVCKKLKLISDEDPCSRRRDFLIEVLIVCFEKRQSQKDAVNALPLYPNEQIMWDESLVPSINYTGEGCLAQPKLNLQFLTLHDYLLKNFNRRPLLIVAMVMQGEALAMLVLSKHRAGPKLCAVKAPGLGDSRRTKQVLYGYDAFFSAAPMLSADCNKSVSELWLKRAAQAAMLREKLTAAQNRMKVQVDKQRTNREFQLGDSVLLKLRPYAQQTLVNRPCSKLAFKYFGPFQVLQRIGSVAYLSCLSWLLLLKVVWNQLLFWTPERRMVQKGNHAIPQVLLRWTNLPEDATTWDDYNVVKTRYPDALA